MHQIAFDLLGIFKTALHVPNTQHFCIYIQCKILKILVIWVRWDCLDLSPELRSEKLCITTLWKKRHFPPKTVGRGVNVGWASFAHGYDQKAVAACMQGGGAWPEVSWGFCSFEKAPVLFDSSLGNGPEARELLTEPCTLLRSMKYSVRIMHAYVCRSRMEVRRQPLGFNFLPAPLCDHAQATRLPWLVPLPAEPFHWPRAAPHLHATV